MTALASVLHSFYNGLENIFLSIARHVDQQVPTGDRWHRAGHALHHQRGGAA
jgi:hypothetical protein